jgi:hypothetical protein
MQRNIERSIGAMKLATYLKQMTRDPEAENCQCQVEGDDHPDHSESLCPNLD